jgi:hypothetical protein
MSQWDGRDHEKNALTKRDSSGLFLAGTNNTKLRLSGNLPFAMRYRMADNDYWFMLR